MKDNLDTWDSVSFDDKRRVVDFCFACLRFSVKKLPQAKAHTKKGAESKFAFNSYPNFLLINYKLFFTLSIKPLFDHWHAEIQFISFFNIGK